MHRASASQTVGNQPLRTALTAKVGKISASQTTGEQPIGNVLRAKVDKIPDAALPDGDAPVPDGDAPVPDGDAPKSDQDSASTANSPTKFARDKTLSIAVENASASFVYQVRTTARSYSPAEVKDEIQCWVRNDWDASACKHIDTICPVDESFLEFGGRFGPKPPYKPAPKSAPKTKQYTKPTVAYNPKRLYSYKPAPKPKPKPKPKPYIKPTMAYNPKRLYSYKPAPKPAPKPASAQASGCKWVQLRDSGMSHRKPKRTQ